MNNQALNKIGYGLYILTARCGGQDNGCIVNTFIQLASSPLRFGVSVSKENLSCGMLQKSAEFNNLRSASEMAMLKPFMSFISILHQYCIGMYIHCCTAKKILKIFCIMCSAKYGKCEIL